MPTKELFSDLWSSHTNRIRKSAARWFPAIIAAAVLCLPAQSLAQSVPAERLDTRYAIKFLCGGSSEGFQEGVVRGVHATAVNILNPSFNQPVRFQKRVSRALPYQASGTLTDTQDDQIGPNEAIEVECNEIRQMLPQQMSAQFRTGFLLLNANGPLVVTAVYTSRPHNGDVSTIDVENVPALAKGKPPDTPPAQQADLVVQAIEIAGVSCPTGAGSCVTRARVRIANIGTGAAGPMSTRTVLDPRQSVQVDTASPAGLAAGATQSFSIATPPGGNCFDPDCEICATVDHTLVVAESDETNNTLCVLEAG